MKTTVSLHQAGVGPGFPEDVMALGAEYSARMSGCGWVSPFAPTVSPGICLTPTSQDNRTTWRQPMTFSSGRASFPGHRMSDIDADLREKLDEFRRDFQQLRFEVGKVIVGQQSIVDAVLVSLVAGGHVLLEGVPGLGKTLLVRTLASALQAKFSRVQFTPDLMPADLVGTNVLVQSDSGDREFRFEQGPLFANVVLADEINRATPKTQSALLESMQERSITVGGVTHRLDQMFFVLATQNPLEMEGTYPLPEAQLDRFLFKLLVPFPTTSDMETILDRTTEGYTTEAQPLFEPTRVLEMSGLARKIPISDEVRRYAIQVIMATHPEHELATPMTRQFVRYGSSPRGAQAVILAAKIHAILDSRYHVAREDIQAVAANCLRHRVLLNFEGQAEDVKTDSIIEDVLKNAKVASLVPA